MARADSRGADGAGLDRMLARLVTAPGRDDCLTHVEHLPARRARYGQWPRWLDPDLRQGLVSGGIERPWQHQAEAAELAWNGRNVILATGTASGKSLAFWMPALTAVQAKKRDVSERRAAALYLSPTKALAGDQITHLDDLVEAAGLDGVRAGVYDGDTPAAERRWIRKHGNLVLTNPDMLHHGILPGHAQWAAFLRVLRFVIVDEAHSYRGVFGAHTSLVLQRLRRAARRYGADPTFVLASATSADPEVMAGRLIADDVTAVTDDASPHGATTIALWQPAILPGHEPHPGASTRQEGIGGGEEAATRGPMRDAAPVRRSATAESAGLLADLVAQHAQTLVFARSRRGAEQIARGARRVLDQAAEQTGIPALAEAATRIAAYRGGYLASERRQLESDLRSGSLQGLASTNALELGIDVSGLDAVVVTGWPGTRASLWQQAGRAGRRHDDAALVIFVARDDPLDTFLVHHPEAIFGEPVESAVFDPSNPYVLMPHLCAAAGEFPIREDEAGLFGPTAPALLDLLAERHTLRRRPQGWYWTDPSAPQDLADLRGSGGEPVRIVESGSGQLLGTIDAASADEQVHDGAVYVQQGQTFVVDHLDVENAVAFVHRDDPLVTTHARSTSTIEVRQVNESVDWGRGVRVRTGTVDVTDHVVGYQVRDVFTAAVLGSYPLDLPPRTLTTTACWWEIPEELARSAGIAEARLPGSLHGAEHCAISLLPLLATCDRWDLGGVSTALHEDTGMPTVFVYDGTPGGAGFAEQGFRKAAQWLRATLDAVRSCPCEHGCPSCIQSPKCGNGNEPLDKAGAISLLEALCAAADEQPA